jgi:hypothetical protein
MTKMRIIIIIIIGHIIIITILWKVFLLSFNLLEFPPFILNVMENFLKFSQHYKNKITTTTKIVNQILGILDELCIFS